MVRNFLLLHYICSINSFLDPNAAELAKELDGLPLALATAAAYLDQVATANKVALPASI